jgi:hypothetical protein
VFPCSSTEQTLSTAGLDKKASTFVWLLIPGLPIATASEETPIFRIPPDLIVGDAVAASGLTADDATGGAGLEGVDAVLQAVSSRAITRTDNNDRAIQCLPFILDSFFLYYSLHAVSETETSGLQAYARLGSRCSLPWLSYCKLFFLLAACIPFSSFSVILPDFYRYRHHTEQHCQDLHDIDDSSGIR